MSDAAPSTNSFVKCWRQFYRFVVRYTCGICCSTAFFLNPYKKYTALSVVGATVRENAKISASDSAFSIIYKGLTGGNQADYAAEIDFSTYMTLLILLASLSPFVTQFIERASMNDLLSISSDSPLADQASQCLSFQTFSNRLDPGLNYGSASDIGKLRWICTTSSKAEYMSFNRTNCNTVVPGYLDTSYFEGRRGFLDIAALVFFYSLVLISLTTFRNRNILVRYFLMRKKRIVKMSFNFFQRYFLYIVSFVYFLILLSFKYRFENIKWCGRELKYEKSYESGLTDAFKTALVLFLAAGRVAGAQRRIYSFCDVDKYLGVAGDSPVFYHHGGSDDLARFAEAPMVDEADAEWDFTTYVLRFEVAFVRASNGAYCFNEFYEVVETRFADRITPLEVVDKAANSPQRVEISLSFAEATVNPA